MSNKQNLHNSPVEQSGSGSPTWWLVFVRELTELWLGGKAPILLLIYTILLGIIGAVVGGFLGRALGFYGPDDPAGFLMSLLGSILLLAIYRMAVRRRTI